MLDIAIYFDIIEHMFVSSEDPTTEPESFDDLLDEVCHQRARLELAELRWVISLSEMIASGLVELHGYQSPVSFLVHRARMSRSHARRLLTLATQLNTQPQLRRAAIEGCLSVDQLQVLCSAAWRFPVQFEEFQDTFIAQAQELSVPQLRVVIKYWTDALEGPRNPVFSHPDYRSRVITSTDSYGMVRLDARFTPDEGEAVLTAIDAVVSDRIRKDPAPEVDRRTQGELRAEALADICTDFLNRSDRPTVGGERPHVTVVVDLPTLLGNDYTRCELASGVPVHPEIMRRICCDARVQRIVFGPKSKPLDVGRSTRTIPQAIRAAVTARDRHCRFPGCDRSPRYSEVHHIDHWTDGGPTSTENCVLMCRRHHHLIHEGGYRLDHDPGGGLRFYNPVGTVLAERQYPSL